MRFYNKSLKGLIWAPSAAIFLLYVLYLFWNAFSFTGYEGQWELYVLALNSGADIKNDLGYLLPSLYPSIWKYFYNNGDLTFIYVRLFHIFLFCIIPLIIYQFIKINSSLNKSEVIFVSIGLSFIPFLFSPLRVADYHIFSLLGTLFIIYLIHDGIKWRNLVIASLVVSVVISIRPHDGVLLFLAYQAAVFVRLKYKAFPYSFISSILFIIFTFLISPEILSAQYWASAADAKGVSVFSIISVPLKAILSIPNFFLLKLEGLVFISLLSLHYLLNVYKGDSFYEKEKIIINLLFSILYAYLISISHGILNITAIFIVLASMVLLMYKNDKKVSYMSSILLPSVAYFFSSAMSSKGHISDHSTITLTLVPFLTLIFFRYKSIFSNFLYVFIPVLILSLSLQKMSNPFSWHIYTSEKMFSNFKFDNSLLVHKSSARIANKLCPFFTGDKTVLSLPFSPYHFYCKSYSNLYKNYISTFYDTSNHSYITKLIDDLDLNPPDRILYLRQTKNLNMHDQIFSGIDNSIPHLSLDRMIVNKIYNGNWRINSVVSLSGSEVNLNEQYEFPDNSWIVIDTNH